MKSKSNSMSKQLDILKGYKDYQDELDYSRQSSSDMIIQKKTRFKKQTKESLTSVLDTPNYLQKSPSEQQYALQEFQNKVLEDALLAGKIPSQPQSRRKQVVKSQRQQLTQRKLEDLTTKQQFLNKAVEQLYKDTESDHQITMINNNIYIEDDETLSTNHIKFTKGSSPGYLPSIGQEDITLDPLQSRNNNEISQSQLLDYDTRQSSNRRQKAVDSQLKNNFHKKRYLSVSHESNKAIEFQL